MNSKIEEIIVNRFMDEFHVTISPEKVKCISNLLDQEMVKFAEWVQKGKWEYAAHFNKWFEYPEPKKVIAYSTSDLLTLYKAEMNTKECG